MYKELKGGGGFHHFIFNIDANRNFTGISGKPPFIENLIPIQRILRFVEM